MLGSFSGLIWVGFVHAVTVSLSPVDTGRYASLESSGDTPFGIVLSLASISKWIPGGWVGLWADKDITFKAECSKSLSP